VRRLGSLVTFVAARFLQGIGGAMMVPVGRVIIARSVDKSELVKAVSYSTLPALWGRWWGSGRFPTTYFIGAGCS
jgi:MFS family permease